MATFDPSAPSAAWQLPWLRVSLILRRMVDSTDCRAEDLAELAAMRHRVAVGGWFN
jgi:hypothetical protein